MATLAAHYYKEKYEALLEEMVVHDWELMEAMAKIEELEAKESKNIEEEEDVHDVLLTMSHVTGAGWRL